MNKYLIHLIRKSFVLTGIMILLSFLTAPSKLSAQTKTKALVDYTFHGQRYFKMHGYQRLNEILASASTQLQKEKQEVQRLKNKNDSLLATGNLYDSVSVDVAQKLTKWNARIDSFNSIIASYQGKMPNFKTFRPKYAQLHKKITPLGNIFRNSIPESQAFFNAVDLQLQASDFSADKERLKGILNSATAQQQKEAVIIEGIDTQRSKQLEEGNVDASHSIKIGERLSTYRRRMDSIATEITGLQANLNSPQEVSKDFLLIKTKVLIIDSIVNKNAFLREYNFQMIEEGLSISKPHPFKLAAFFGPGGFKIPAAKYDFARNYFSPVIDSLILFSNAYSNSMRTATIIVNGYSDAANISPGSPLHTTLVKYLGSDNYNRQQLNAALSALRAEEISILLTKLLKERFPEFKLINRIVFEAIESGKGEELPNPKIKDYRKSDERRRIVVIFWNVIPAE